MTLTVTSRRPKDWSLPQKVSFRFLFIYFAWQTAPWTWLDTIPGIRFITRYYYRAIDWLVDIFNKAFFHFNKTTIFNKYC